MKHFKFIKYSEEKFTKDMLNNMRSIVSVSDSSVNLYFYSRRISEGYQLNISNEKDYKNIDFDNTKQSVFIIHGWNDRYNLSMAQTVKDAYLTAVNYNIFLVDWGIIANESYIAARTSVSQLGVVVGKKILVMVEKVSLNLNLTGIVGHSLGAQISGNVGRSLSGNLSYIIGK